MWRWKNESREPAESKEELSPEESFVEVSKEDEEEENDKSSSFIK